MKFAWRCACLVLAALLIFLGPVEAMASAREVPPEPEAGEAVMEASNGERTRRPQGESWESASLNWLLLLAFSLPMLITAALLAAMNRRKR